MIVLLTMFKLLAVKIPGVSKVACSRTLKFCSSALDPKYTPFWRVTFAKNSIRMPAPAPGCRLYATKVPQLHADVQVNDIWTELCETNLLPVTDVQSCREIIKLLLSLHYHKSHIVRELSENPVLLKFPIIRWKETVSDLQSCGFKEPHILPLLVGCHALLCGTAWDNLNEMLIFLHSLQLSPNRRMQIIARNPLLLQSHDTRPIMQKYSNLVKMFTKNEVQMLIIKNPFLLTDPVEETNGKINYVYNEMGIRSQEITRSEVFQHSLAHIITRHKFAERAGVYKMPERHDITAKEMNLKTVVSSSNPSLTDLVDTSNDTFTTSFCSMTVAEYKVFEAMMMEELQEETEDSGSDLSDSDSDNE